MSTFWSGNFHWRKINVKDPVIFKFSFFAPSSGLGVKELSFVVPVWPARTRSNVQISIPLAAFTFVFSSLCSVSLWVSGNGKLWLAGVLEGLVCPAQPASDSPSLSLCPQTNTAHYQRNTTQHNKWNNTTRHNTTQHCSIPTTQCNTTRHNATQHDTAQHNSTQNMI